jgi:hypothetical protein
MGNICDEFTKFKNKYNTKSKLLKNKEESGIQNLFTYSYG